MARLPLFVFVLIVWFWSPANAAPDIDFGRYHALVIGVDDYRYLPSLSTAVNDAVAVAEILRRRYNFNVAVLLNPGRAEIFGALERLRVELTERDNLLIYYAGRGILDDENETSYWQPADAERRAGANRISAGALSDVLYAMSARHVMVVSDAAYSGTVARRPRLAIKLRARREAMLAWLSRAASRTALVSGSIEPLDDGAGDGHSVFARGFLSAMREPKETFEGGELFAAIRRLVLGNPSQTPRYANIFRAGHNGGDFLFVPVGPDASADPEDQRASAESDAVFADRRAWERIIDSVEPSDFEGFLNAHPSSDLATRARTRLAALRALALGGRDPDDPWETLQVSVIIHCCRGDDLWKPLIHGARQAGQLFNVDVIIQNADGDAAHAKRRIEAAIAGEADGIVAMIAFEDKMTDVIQRARDAGIPVIVSNRDTDGRGDDAGLAFVGEDYFAAGYRIGGRMVEKHGLADGDFCLVPAEFPDFPYARERHAGVRTALEEAGVLSQMIETGATLDENLSTISEYLSAHPETDCVIGLGGVATAASPEAAAQAGMAGLPNGGFDIIPWATRNITAGLTTATVDRQPFWQGFLPIMFIAYNVRYGLAPPDVDTAKGMVDRENAPLATKWAGTYR